MIDASDMLGAALIGGAPEEGTGGPQCSCEREHRPRLVVVTGGPGAGKTAVLEIVRRSFCQHVAVLPEAAGIVFGGGFPRGQSLAARGAAQIAIYHLQRQLEAMALAESGAAVILCDRGTLDGLAYWPGEPASFYEAVGTTQAEELARYATVIHLRTPSLENGYHRGNPLRIESAVEAQLIDDRIQEAWSHHPRRALVPASTDFMTKAAMGIAEIRRETPACCLAAGKSTSSRARHQPEEQP
jgi:predicted ATPase